MKRKQRILKHTAALLTIAMMFTVVGTPISQAKQLSDQNNPVETVTAEEPPVTDGAEAEPEIIGELENLREENIKHFVMSDHSVTAAIYDDPVHYQENGQWKEIDNSLFRESALDQEDVNGVANSRNDFKVKFANKGDSNKLVTLKKGGDKLSWQIVGASAIHLKQQQKAKQSKEQQEDKTAVLNQSSGVIYQNLLPYVDVRYTVSSKMVKEDIILKDKRAQREYQILFDTRKLEMRQNADHTIDVIDPKTPGEVLFRVEAPYVYDAKQESTTDVEVQLIPQKKGYLLTMSIDEEWLNAPERAFPVTLDPAVQTDLDIESIHDAVIYSNQPNTAKYQANINRAGYFQSNENSSQHYISRSLVKLPLPTIPESARVIDAKMFLCSTPGNTADVNYGFNYWPVYGDPQHVRYPVNKSIGVYQINSAWEEKNPTWNNIGSKFHPIPADFVKYQYDPNNITKQWVWDITKFAQNWYAGDPNYGVMLKEVDETPNIQVKGHSDVSFLSSDIGDQYKNGRPTALIRYLDGKGLEEYWTYTQQDLGAAGIGHVNDWTGHLVYTHPTTTGVGERMPASISHVYNSNARTTDIGFGAGFRLNISQSVKWMNPNGSDPLEKKMYEAGFHWRYTDSDGTDIYFYKTNNKWVDETGKGYVLESNTTTKRQTITDKDGNKLVFYDGPLGEIHDTNGNVIKITYSGNHPVKVTDPAGKVTTLTYSGGRLSKITEPTGKSAAFTYHTAAGTHQGELLTITRTDGGITQLQYGWNVKGLLRSMRDSISQYAVKYERTAAPSYRVSEIKEYSNTTYSGETVNTPDANLGQKITVSYGINTATYRSPGKDAVYGNTDDLLNKYRFDSKGKTMQVTTTSSDGKTLYGAGAYQYTKDSSKTAGDTPSLAEAYQVNKLTGAMSQGRNTNNYVTNSGFEILGGSNINTISTATGWWLSDMGNPDQGVTCKLSDLVSSGDWAAELKVPNKSDRFVGVATDLKNLKPNTTYTFSGDLRVWSGNGAKLRVTVHKKDGTEQTYYSETLSADNPDIQRTSVTFTTPSEYEWVHAYAGFNESSGTLYADNFQTETGNVANPYNLLENSSFETGTAAQWPGSQLESGKDKVTTSPVFDGSKSYTFQGVDFKKKFIRQKVTINPNKAKGKTFIVSGWAKNTSGAGPSVYDQEGFKNEQTKQDRIMAIAIALVGTSGSVRWIPGAEFDLNYNDWQFTSRAFTIGENEICQTIEIYLCYYNNVGSATFDNIQLIQESYNSYTYDEKGNVISAAANAEQKSSMEYSSDNQLVKQLDSMGYDNTYDYQQKTHNMQAAVSANGVASYYNYDRYGNMTSARTGRQLLAYYKFEDNMHDSAYSHSSDKSYDIQGTNTKFVTGKYGKGLYFNGSSSYATFPKELMLEDQFSVSMWVRPNATTAGQAFLDKSDSSGNDIVLLGLYSGVHGKIRNDGQSAGSMTTGWQHLVMTVSKVNSSTTEIQVYKDAKLLFSKRCNGVFATGGQKWMLGADWDNVNGKATRTDFFKGDIDEVAFFDGVLSKKEITQIGKGINPSNYSTSTLKNSAAYTSDGRFVTNTTAPGSDVDYTYNQTKGLLTSQKENTTGLTTSYQYNGYDQPTKVTSTTTEGKSYAVDYGYNSKRQLSSVTHNGFSYGFQYDSFGNLLKTTLGSRTLMTNSYQGKNGALLKSTYGNGDYWEYGYDKIGQITDQKFNGSTRYQWVYDSFGNVKTHKDLKNNRTYHYNYDTNGRINGYRVSGEINGSAWYSYDKNNSIILANYNAGNYSYWKTDYAYNKDNQETKSSFGNSTLDSGYDKLGRVKSYTLKNDSGKTLYSVNQSYTSSAGGVRPDQGVLSGSSYTVGGKQYSLSQYYTKANQLSQVSDSRFYKSTYYQYDGLGQLVRENNERAGKTYTYTYDNAGNLLKRQEYKYTTGTLGAPTKTVNYTYGNSEWKDLLTTWDGWKIQYDEIGNPTSYKKNMWCTWDGRQLVSLSGGPYDSTKYTYNADGIRTSKTTGGVTTKFYLDGSRVIRQESAKGSMNFSYDSNGVVRQIDYFKNSATNGNWEIYYPLYNLQGDVVALLDENGSIAVEYLYDAWGQVLSITDGTGKNIIETNASHIGWQNPFRYRGAIGYYYDSETGFYYLQSRYYDPEVGRFINADGQLNPENLGKNLFSYCGNDPVNAVDPTGHAWWHWALGALVVVGCAAATVITAGGFAAAAGAVAAVGSGVAAASTTSTVAAGAFIGSATAFGVAAATASATSRSPKEFADKGNWGTVANTAAGAVLGGAGAYVGNKSSSTPKASKPSGSPFKTGQKVGTTQIGVDPKTLKINMNAINKQKYLAAKQRINREGMYGAIEVYSDGRVYNGNHRTLIGVEQGISVDTIVIFK